MILYESLIAVSLCVLAPAQPDQVIVRPEVLPRVSATSSSTEASAYQAYLAADGNPATRWSSAFADDQWMEINLGASRHVSSITVRWQDAFAKSYRVEVSEDGVEFEEVASFKDVTERRDERITLRRPREIRAVRVHGVERATQWGFSIIDVLLDGEPVVKATDLASPPKNAPYRNAALPVDQRLDDLIPRMSLSEKLRLLSGADMFFLSENERLGLPRIRMADASIGVKGAGKSTAFPAFVCLAATFDPAIASRYGDAIGEESRAHGVHFLLGPGVNIYRVPQGGRNFEYLGEDPYLASKLVVPYIQSLQAHGVAATVKHFVANNSEWYRKNTNVVADERTLREIYLPAFRAAVQEADVHAVMTAYNLVNGELMGQHRGLVQHLLRDEWGFDGLVMTDWWSVHDPLKVIRSGVDLEMPEPVALNELAVRRLIASGQVDETEIDRMLRNVLGTCMKLGFYDRDQVDPEALGFGGAHNEVALDTARSGIVLLKNDDGLLPIERRRVRKIALVGENARQTRTMGEGAAKVPPTDPVHILDAVREAAGRGVEVVQVDTPDVSIEDADIVLVSLTTVEREANDRPFDLPESDLALIEGSLQLNKKVVVLLSTGSGVNMSPWIDRTPGVVQAWYLGNVGVTALAEILFGDVNPSGKLPFTMERQWSDNAAYGNYLPADAFDPNNEVPFGGGPIWGNDHAVFDQRYDEGLLVGYRHFDAHDIEPLFPFGFGLSYTTFSLDNLRITRSAGSGLVATVSCTLTNTGKRAGAEVVQLYVSAPDAPVSRPMKELKGFRKVVLEPGESAEVAFAVRAEELSYWDPASREWTLAPGTFRFLVGTSSRDIALRGSLDVK